MRLYLSADTTKHLGYIPDWIKLTSIDGEVLTLDVNGEIDYKSDGLCCRVKGDLIPWVFEDAKEEECETKQLQSQSPQDTFLNFIKDMERLQKQFPEDILLNLIKKSSNIMIGLHCTNDLPEEKMLPLAENDTFTNKRCDIEILGERYVFSDFDIYNNDFDIEYENDTVLEPEQ